MTRATIAALLILMNAPAFAKTPSARAVLIDASGKPVGTVSVKDAGDGLDIAVKARGIEPGIRGIHLHAVGKCELPKFVSAGPHWNPAMKMHGKDNPMGPHAGDLPNLTVGKNRRVSYKASARGFSLTGDKGLIDADGGAVIIHASPDDYKSDPTGNAGDRIMCGVLRLK